MGKRIAGLKTKTIKTPLGKKILLRFDNKFIDSYMGLSNENGKFTLALEEDGDSHIITIVSEAPKLKISSPSPKKTREWEN